MMKFCGASEDDDSGEQMTRGGLYCYFICSCILMLNLFLLAIGRRTRIVGIGRQQSVNSQEERTVGAVESMDSERGAHR